MKLLLILTEKQAILYNQDYEILLTCEGKFEDIEAQISSFLSQFPKVFFHLLIDWKTTSLHENRLPPLYPWDLIRLIFHKKKEWKSKNSFYGYSLLKQDNASYLRWTHISEADPLYPWLLWFETFPKLRGDIFFVPFEIGGFLKKQPSHLPLYQMLFYSLSPQASSYVIFEKERLLLMRPFHGNDDFQAALHFLSRKFPDIHEKLQIYSVSSGTAFPNAQVIKLNEPHCLLRYFFSQKKPYLKIQRRFHLTQAWMKTSILGFLTIFSLLNGVLLYQAYDYKNKLHGVDFHNKKLEAHLRTLKSDLGDKDIPFLRKTLQAYSFLKSQNGFSIQILEKVALLLKDKPLRLESVSLKQDRGLEIILDLSMKTSKTEVIIEDFDQLLLTCTTIFPQGHISILEAPLSSGPHETLKSGPTSPLPLTKIRIYLP